VCVYCIKTGELVVDNKYDDSGKARSFVVRDERGRAGASEIILRDRTLTVCDWFVLTPAVFLESDREITPNLKGSRSRVT